MANLTELLEQFKGMVEDEYMDSLMTCLSVTNAVAYDDKIFETFIDQMSEHHEMPKGTTADDFREVLIRSINIVTIVNHDAVMEAKAEAYREDECGSSDDIFPPPSMTMV